MKTSLKLVTIKGISVYVHFTFLFFILWLVTVYIVSGMQWQQLTWSVVFLFAVFACIIFHEYGHAFVAAWFGINAKKITIYPIGGIASIEKLPENPKQELLISGAGPAVSFFLAALFLLFAPQPFSWQGFREYTGELNRDTILFTLGWANIALAVFNLIPAFPMDGGRILRALLAFRYNYLKATSIAAATGKVIAFFIIVIAILSMNLLLALIGVFIIVFARAEESYLQLRTLVKGIQLKDVVMYDYKSIDAELTVNEAANIIAGQSARFYIIMYEGVPVGTVSRMDVMKAVSEQAYDKKVTELMKEEMDHLEGDMFVEDVLDKISGHEERMYPVFDREKFLGVVNFQHIIEYLLIHKAASKEYLKTKSLAGLV